MPNCGSLSLVLATEIDCRSSFKFHWTSWHIKCYEDIRTATFHAVTHILLVLCSLPSSNLPFSLWAARSFTILNSKHNIWVNFRAGAKIHRTLHTFPVYLDHHKQSNVCKCVPSDNSFYICLSFMAVSAATEVRHILFNDSGPHCFGLISPAWPLECFIL